MRSQVELRWRSRQTLDGGLLCVEGMDALKHWMPQLVTRASFYGAAGGAGGALKAWAATLY